MFDFRFDLKWEAPDLDEGPAKGVLAYPDVGQDCGGIYEAECRVRRLGALECGGLWYPTL